MMTQTATNQQYQAFQEKRESLTKLIQRQLAVVRSLSMAGWEETLHRLEKRIQTDNFKVLVLGEFRRGKSTFINALLGDEILPAYAIPTTAIINEVKWGEPPRALLHHTKSKDNLGKQPQEIPVEQLEEYVVIKNGVSESDAINGNPYEKVELFWPLELCRNGVEIIDSPGLNEHEIRQKVTMDYLSTVDAILFVFSCEVLGSQSELNVIDNTLLSMGHEDIFFICNRFNMIRAKEQDSIRQHGLSKLAPRTKRGAERVFFINALGALEGRLNGDNAAIEQSGVPHLEKELEKFLATERGRLKILRPAIDLKNSIREARRIIPEREAMLRTDIATLEARYAAAQEPLQQLETLRHQIVAKVVNFRADMKQLVRDKARTFYRNISDDKIDKYDNKIVKWVQEYEIKAPIKTFSKDILPWQISAAIERVVQELTEHLASTLEGELAAWQKLELQPFLISSLQELTQELNAKASVFVSQVDELRIKVSGSSVQSDKVFKSASPLDRILSFAGGILLQNPMAAALGGVFGIKETLINFALQIGVGAAAGALCAFNPLIMLPAMLGTAGLRSVIKMNGTNDDIKKAFAKEYAEQTRRSSAERADEIANAVAEKLLQLQNDLDQRLAKEIQSVRGQVNSILAEKQKGQTNVDQKLRQLEALERSLNGVDSELDELINQVSL